LSYEFGEVWWSVLSHLSEGHGHNNRRDGVPALKRRLQAFYKENKVDSQLPLKRFKMSTIKGKGKPKLRVKAAQARRLVPFTLALAEEFQNKDGELGRHRLEAIRTLSGMCDLASRRELSQSDLVTWRWLAAKHMFHYTSCNFAVYPKHHYFLHLPEHAENGGVPTTRALGKYRANHKASRPKLEQQTQTNPQTNNQN
jgi:hypothetical protein